MVHKWPFFQLFFLGNQGQKNVFYDILERKTPFSAIKKRSWKSRKIDVFPKVDIFPNTHGFGPKMAIFPIFFFREYRPANVFYDIVERKNAFLGY